MKFHFNSNKHTGVNNFALNAGIFNNEYYLSIYPLPQIITLN